MKTLLLLLAFCSIAAHAAATKLEIVSAHLGVEDQAGNRALCVSVVRLPKSGETFGLVESLYDCFYARAAKKTATIELDLAKLTPVEPVLRSHLQSLDGTLEFLYSDGE